MIPEHYPRGRAPKEGTPVAIGYLREYVKQFPNQQKATSALLGCDLSTAKRLLSRSKPYTARIKVDWAYRICAAVGQPPVRVLGRKGVRLFPKTILGWHKARSRPEAMELAVDCASSIALMAMIHYGLTGHFSVSYQHGYVSQVVIYLSPAPELTIEGGKNNYHRIVIAVHKDTDGVQRMWMQHIDPEDGGAKDKDSLTPKSLEQLLYYVYTLTKNNTTKLQREFLRRQAAESGRLDRRGGRRFAEGGRQRFCR